MQKCIPSIIPVTHFFCHPRLRAGIQVSKLLNIEHLSAGGGRAGRFPKAVQPQGSPTSLGFLPVDILIIFWTYVLTLIKVRSMSIAYQSKERKNFSSFLKKPRTVGVRVWGIRAPVIKEGDNLQDIVIESFKAAIDGENIRVQDNDVLAVTESLVARTQGNYVTLDDIAQEIKEKYSKEIAVVFPILSRNRFSMILKAIARGAKHVHLFLSYPPDEVGNCLIDPDILEESGIDPSTDLLTEEKYRSLFGETVLHPFTGIDYVSLYKEMANNGNISIYLSNNPKPALEVTDEILCADIHSRHRTKRLFKKIGAKTVYGLDDLCAKPSTSKGYNSEYGLLGSNKATEEKIKLFPRDGQQFVDNLHERLKLLTGKNIEVMIYGDGAFKDPVGKIWELADPVVAPAFTMGLSGLPSELKLKYLADNLFKGLSGEDLVQAMKNEIKKKPKDLIGNMASGGTTPRRLTDLLGSLCDLTSGSGDKGTPIILIQGYFDNYATE